jgi:hypothetical protein
MTAASQSEPALAGRHGLKGRISKRGFRERKVECIVMLKRASLTRIVKMHSLMWHRYNAIKK